jgi:hypothetical protein
MANRHHDDERQRGRRGFSGRDEAGDRRGGARPAGQSRQSGRRDEDESGAARGRGGFSDRGVERRPHRGADDSRSHGPYEERVGFEDDLESREASRGARGGAYGGGRSARDDEERWYPERPRSPYRDEDDLERSDRRPGRSFAPLDPDEYGEVTRRGSESRYGREVPRGHRSFEGREAHERYRDEFGDAEGGGYADRTRQAGRGEPGSYGGGYARGAWGDERSWRRDEEPRNRRGRGWDPDEGFGDAGPGQGGQGGYGGTSDYVSRSRYGGGGRGQRSYGDDAWEEPRDRDAQRASGRSSGEATRSGRSRSSSRGRTGSHAESQPRDEHGRFSSSRRSAGGKRSSGGGSSRNR